MRIQEILLHQVWVLVFSCIVVEEREWYYQRNFAVLVGNYHRPQFLRVAIIQLFLEIAHGVREDLGVLRWCGFQCQRARSEERRVGKDCRL